MTLSLLSGRPLLSFKTFTDVKQDEKKMTHCSHYLTKYLTFLTSYSSRHSNGYLSDRHDSELTVMQVRKPVKTKFTTEWSVCSYCLRKKSQRCSGKIFVKKTDGQSGWTFRRSRSLWSNWILLPYLHFYETLKRHTIVIESTSMPRWCCFHMLSGNRPI